MQGFTAPRLDAWYQLQCFAAPRLDAWYQMEGENSITILNPVSMSRIRCSVNSSTAPKAPATLGQKKTGTTKKGGTGTGH